jgi:hypothetical protein
MRAVLAGCGINPLGSAALDSEVGKNKEDNSDNESERATIRFFTSS